MGWVVTSKRRGVMVAPRPPLQTPEERQQRLEQAVSELLIATHPLDVNLEDIHAEIDRQWGNVSARDVPVSHDSYR